MGVYSFNSDDEALVPYQRLIELGSDGSGNIGSYFNANQELQDYISVNSLDEVVDKLTKWKDNYFALRKDSLVDKGHYDRFPSLGWEVGIRSSRAYYLNAVILTKSKTQDPDDF